MKKSCLTSNGGVSKSNEDVENSKNEPGKEGPLGGCEGKFAQSSDETTPEYWGEKINQRVRRTVEDQLEICRLLKKAKETLGQKGQWKRLIDIIDLPGGLRAAQNRVKIAEHPVLCDANNYSRLPATEMTLVVLSRAPEDAVKQALQDGTIHPKTAIKEAKAFLEKQRAPKEGRKDDKPQASPEDSAEPTGKEPEVSEADCSQEQEESARPRASSPSESTDLAEKEQEIQRLIDERRRIDEELKSHFHQIGKFELYQKSSYSSLSDYVRERWALKVSDVFEDAENDKGQNGEDQKRSCEAGSAGGEIRPLNEKVRQGEFTPLVVDFRELTRYAGWEPSVVIYAIVFSMYALTEFYPGKKGDMLYEHSRKLLERLGEPDSEKIKAGFFSCSFIATVIAEGATPGNLSDDIVCELDKLTALAGGQKYKAILKDLEKLARDSKAAAKKKAVKKK